MISETASQSSHSAQSNSSSKPELSLERYFSLRRIQSLAVSPCGSWAAAAISRLDEQNKKYISDLWHIPLEANSTLSPRPLTRGDYSDSSPAFRNDGSLAFLSKRPSENGKSDKYNQIWILPKQGEAYPLTNEPLGVSEFQFSKTGERLIVVAPVRLGVPHEQQRERHEDIKEKGPSSLHYTSMPVRFWDHWNPTTSPHIIQYHHDGQGRVDLTPNADNEYRNCDWTLSPDGRLLVIQQFQKPGKKRHEHCLQCFDLEDQTNWEIDRQEDGGYELFTFSPDSQQVAFVRSKFSKEESYQRPIFKHHFGEKATSRLAEQSDIWVQSLLWNQDGKSLLCCIHENGHVPIYALDIESQVLTKQHSAKHEGSHQGIQQIPNSNRIVGIRHTFFHPPEVFTLEPGDDTNASLQTQLSGWTEEEGRALATLESFTVQGANGDPVQSFILFPKNSSETETLPNLQWIHGGPISHWSNNWHWRWNPMLAVAQGYSVTMPNPRGSTGFGQRFIDGIWGNRWGEACYEDLQAVFDEVASRKHIDEHRMVAMGGSFGGYMTNWIGTQTERFRCLVTHASLFALSHFYGTTDLPHFWTAMNGDPLREGVSHDRYSPHLYIEQWKTPTLIIHGDKDYRVSVGESLHLFEALQARGVESELLIFPDENHWIQKPQNALTWYQKIFIFLEKHLSE